MRQEGQEQARDEPGVAKRRGRTRATGRKRGMPSGRTRVYVRPGRKPSVARRRRRARSRACPAVASAPMQPVTTVRPDAAPGPPRRRLAGVRPRPCARSSRSPRAPRSSRSRRPAAPELFDVPALRGRVRAAPGRRQRGRALQYSTTEGPRGPAARRSRRGCARGAATHADEVLVTTGSQQALGPRRLGAARPGDVVLVEDPSYLAALQSFALAGATLVPGARRATTAPTSTRSRRSWPSTGPSCSTSCRPSRTRRGARSPRGP
jgi:DNA-binding transcriptional MocR family regulator